MRFFFILFREKEKHKILVKMTALYLAKSMIICIIHDLTATLNFRSLLLQIGSWSNSQRLINP
ncbi:hypothetical protein I926_06925 [Pasteurella multocida subsp. multocida OH4807]|nr:hypothetical protein I926_06925 [Pasteurella multocida subsp. multocida OH4807]